MARHLKPPCLRLSTEAVLMGKAEDTLAKRASAKCFATTSNEMGWAHEQARNTLKTVGGPFADWELTVSWWRDW